MAAQPMAPPPPLLWTVEGHIEDTAALLRDCIGTREAEQKRLLAEVEVLQGRIEGLSQAGSGRPDSFVGCSDPVVGEEGLADAERFLLLSSFTRAAPVAGIAVSSDEVVVAASWDGRAQLFDFCHWSACGELDSSAPINEGTIIAYRAGAASPPSKNKGSSSEGKKRNKIGGGGASAGGSAGASGGTEDNSTALVDIDCMARDPGLIGAASGRDVQLWRHTDGELTRQAILRHGAAVARLHFHEAVGMVGSVSDDGAATLWDTESCSVLRCWESEVRRPTSFRFVGGGEAYQYAMVAGGLEGLVQLWDVRDKSPQTIGEGTSGCAAVDCHARSHLLTTGSLSGELRTWDMRTWRMVRTVDMRSQIGPRATPRSLSVSPCGSFLAIGCMDGELAVFDIELQRAFKMMHHSDTVNSLAWGGPVAWAGSPHFLAAGSLDGTWSCWTHSGRAIQEEH